MAWEVEMRGGDRYLPRAGLWCNAVFPPSDHADFNDLLRLVDMIGAKRVLTVHGYAAEFAVTLREREVEVWALGEDNHLEFFQVRTDKWEAW